MGMYTEVFVSGRISTNDPAAPILRALLGDEISEGVELPDHPFFRKPRWQAIGQCSSYYFQPASVHKVWVDSISHDLHFVSLSSLKNYDGEIAAFFDWLAITSASFFGFSRHEESRRNVTHYFGGREDDAE